jgi:hypothetical protein
MHAWMYSQALKKSVRERGSLPPTTFFNYQNHTLDEKFNMDIMHAYRKMCRIRVKFSIHFIFILLPYPLTNMCRKGHVLVSMTQGNLSFGPVRDNNIFHPAASYL